MDQTGVPARRVFVLGRADTSFDAEEAARRSAADGSQLVVLTIGYPLTDGQRRAVDEALDLAWDLRVPFDTMLVASSKEAAQMAQASTVSVVSEGRERKRLERALADAGISIEAPVTERASSGTDPTPAAVTAQRNLQPDEYRSTAVAVEGSEPPSEEPLPTDLGGESVEALAGREIPVPVLETVWTQDEALVKKTAPLRIYLGAAPGVGKTFAMLSEGRRRLDRGTEVVVGVIHTYDRPMTIQMLEGLERVPPKQLEYRGRTFDEMDVEALIARAPEVALVDELAHTNIPGSRRAKRWEDVLDVVSAGIEVITTVNAQHISSLNDVVAAVTGIRQQETVPDWILDVADQVELVDMSPHALQRRMLHGNVYPDPRKAELALQRFFTTENLTALREMALMRVANQVDEELLRRWSRSGTPETRERILVCVSRPDVSDDLIRRGSRIANRTRGDLLVVHVWTGEGARPDRAWHDHVRRLVEDLGGRFELVQGDDAVDAVIAYAHRQHVTQIVVGESLRSRLREVVRGSFVNRLIRRASNVDVHVMARKER